MAHIRLSAIRLSNLTHYASLLKMRHDLAAHLGIEAESMGKALLDKRIWDKRIVFSLRQKHLKDQWVAAGHCVAQLNGLSVMTASPEPIATVLQFPRC